MNELDVLQRRVIDAQAELRAATDQFDATMVGIVAEAREIGIPVNVVDVGPAPKLAFDETPAGDVIHILTAQIVQAQRILDLVGTWCLPGDRRTVGALKKIIPADHAREIDRLAADLGWREP